MTIQDKHGYLESAGSDFEGCHVEFFDGTRHQHYLFKSWRDAEEFIRREFPSREQSSGVTYTGYGANTHAPCGN